MVYLASKSLSQMKTSSENPLDFLKYLEFYMIFIITKPGNGKMNLEAVSKFHVEF